MSRHARSKSRPPIQCPRSSGTTQCHRRSQLRVIGPPGSASARCGSSRSCRCACSSRSAARSAQSATASRARGATSRQTNIALCFPELDACGARCAGATHLHVHRYRRRRNRDCVVRRHLAIARPRDVRRARRADDRTTARPRCRVDRRAFLDARPRRRAVVAGDRPRRDLPLQQESGDRMGDAARSANDASRTSSSAAIHARCSRD